MVATLKLNRGNLQECEALCINSIKILYTSNNIFAPKLIADYHFLKIGI